MGGKGCRGGVGVVEAEAGTERCFFNYSSSLLMCCQDLSDSLSLTNQQAQMRHTYFFQQPVLSSSSELFPFSEPSLNDWMRYHDSTWGRTKKCSSKYFNSMCVCVCVLPHVCQIFRQWVEHSLPWWHINCQSVPQHWISNMMHNTVVQRRKAEEYGQKQQSWTERKDRHWQIHWVLLSNVYSWTRYNIYTTICMTCI